MSIAGFCVWFEVSSFEFALASEITGSCLLHELWHYKVCTLRLCLLTGIKFKRSCFSVHLVCTNFSEFAEQGCQTYSATMVPNYWCTFNRKFAKMSTL